VRAWAWHVVFIAGAVLGALIAARYYVVGVVVARDRTLARSAVAMFFVFTFAAVLYFWRVL